MDIAIIGRLHECTVTVQLPDDSPIIPNDRGYRMKSQKISFFWIKDDEMPTWELMGAEVKGKLMTTTDKIGARDAQKRHWTSLDRQPEWIREIADREDVKPRG